MLWHLGRIECVTVKQFQLSLNFYWLCIFVSLPIKHHWNKEYKSKANFYEENFSSVIAFFLSWVVHTAKFQNKSSQLEYCWHLWRPHWVWVFSYWIRNMKRVPEMSTIFQLQRLFLQARSLIGDQFWKKWTWTTLNWIQHSKLWTIRGQYQGFYLTLI